MEDKSADIKKEFDIEISKVGLQKKYTPKAVEFLNKLILHQLTSKVNCFAIDHNLKNHFKAINIKDSSKWLLPMIYNDYPGFGNFSKTKGVMNLQYEFDLVSGNWKYLNMSSIKRNDQKDSKETIDMINGDELYIRDLGYVTPTYLRAVIERGAYFLNRMPPQVNIYLENGELLTWKKIEKEFKKSNLPFLDLEVFIYEKEKIKCRLILERVNEEEYKKRLKVAEKKAKSRKVGVSEDHKIRCRFNFFITNVDKDILSGEKVRKIYYLRWQIELIFKAWKSVLEIDKTKKVKKERLECELLAKLLWILLNWKFFQVCNNYVQQKKQGIGLSVYKFYKRCLLFSDKLRAVVLKKMGLKEWLEKEFLPLIENTKCEAPWKKMTHYEVVLSFNNMYCM